MFTITIPTHHVEIGDRDAGPIIAALLHQVADKIATDIHIVPYQEDDDDWQTETYRHATRIQGVLIGATWTIAATGQED